MATMHGGQRVLALTVLCFCESGASKPAGSHGFAGFDGTSLILVVVAATLASMMGALLVYLMRRS